MPRIVSKEELFNGIDDELSWRKKELKILKDNLSGKDSPIQRALLRAMTTVLYAHWEGYVKKVCEYYLEYVSERNEIHKSLQPQFIALSMHKQLSKLEIRSIKDKTEAIQFILNNLDSKASFDVKGNIHTKSNLRFDVFNDIGFTINLDLTNFIKYESLINDLVDTRNTIAHGSGHRVLPDTYNQMYTDVIEAMEILRTELQNAVALDKHKLSDITH